MSPCVAASKHCNQSRTSSTTNCSWITPGGRLVMRSIRLIINHFSHAETRTTIVRSTHLCTCRGTLSFIRDNMAIRTYLADMKLLTLHHNPLHTVAEACYGQASGQTIYHMVDEFTLYEVLQRKVPASAFGTLLSTPYGVHAYIVRPRKSVSPHPQQFLSYLIFTFNPCWFTA